MAENIIHDIIAFAIEREKEAAAFYRNLRDRAAFSAVRKMLGDLEAMEMGHVKVLEGIEKRGNAALAPKRIMDLKVSDYLVVPDISEESLEYQDILILAMKREEASFRLYNELAGRSEEEETRKVFLRIASEEAGHKLQFETLYDEHILKEN